MASRPFTFDPSNPRCEEVLSWMCQYIREAGKRLSIVVADPVKSREQEDKYHAIIGEIARDKVLHGKTLPAPSWKRLLIDAFKHDTQNDPELTEEWKGFGGVELLPALNHPGFVMVGEQSRKFSKKLAAAFITWLQAFHATSDREVA